MITNKDIEKLKLIFPTRIEFNAVKEDLEMIKENVKDLPQRLDQIAKSFSDLKDEYIAIKCKQIDMMITYNILQRKQT